MLVNIQFLRFLAALAVVFTHGYEHVVAANGPQDGLFGFFRLFGYAGVDVFFVISGFIIWHTTESLHGRRWVADFLYRRAARIYTGYWPYFLLSLLGFWAVDSTVLERVDYWGSFFLYTTEIKALLLPVSWTLVYELYFYLVFALLLLFSMRLRLRMVAALFVLVLALQLWALWVLDLYRPGAFGGMPQLLRFYASPFCLEFLAGCLLAAFFQRFGAPWWLLLGLALGLGAGGLYVQEAVVGGDLMKGYHRMWRVPFFGGAAFFLVWSLVQLEKIGQVLAPRYGAFLGDISYSLYLSHTILLMAIYFVGLRGLAAQTGYQEVWYLLFSFAIIAYSAAHYRWVERPLRGLSRGLRARYLSTWLEAR